VFPCFFLLVCLVQDDDAEMSRPLSAETQIYERLTVSTALPVEIMELSVGEVPLPLRFPSTFTPGGAKKGPPHF